MTVGVLVMAYGTPRDRDDIEAYYTDIRRGRPPTPEQLADLLARSDALSARAPSGGDGFPLREITEQPAGALAAALDRTDPGGYVVAVGPKHSTPRIEDGVTQLVTAGGARPVRAGLPPPPSPQFLRGFVHPPTQAGGGGGGAPAVGPAPRRRP